MEASCDMNGFTHRACRTVRSGFRKHHLSGIIRLYLTIQNLVLTPAHCVRVLRYVFLHTYAMTDDFQADIAAVQRIDAIPRILEVVCHTTGMGFARGCARHRASAGLPAPCVTPSISD